MKGKIYFPAFVGKDGGAIEKAYDLAQLHDALDFWIGFHSEKTANYSIMVAGYGKLVIEQKSGSTIRTSEYWLTEERKSITIQYINGKDMKLYGCITDLSCYNQLTSLDVSHNPALTYLSCYDNQLTSLDVSHNPALTNLDCTNNQLTSLDLSHNPALTDLICSYNQLTSLDLSHNPALTDLICSNNQLTSLDFSHNPALTDLSCSYNQLTSLDLSHNPALENLNCSNNSLTSLDLSKNPAIVEIICSGNNITYLDISKNQNIGYNGGDFSCFGNPLWHSENLDMIISLLPDWSDGDEPDFFYKCDEESEDEEYKYCLTESQIETIESKGWWASND